jgi:hypothetical protein
MNRITPLFLLSTLLTLAVFSSDVVAQQDTIRNQERQQRWLGGEFVDENGDGIDDRLAQGGRARRNSTDQFVDQDGDGICDGRAKGLGFRYGATTGGFGNMKATGQTAKGRKGEMGGKP